MRHRRELKQLTIEGGAEVVASVDLSPSWGGARPGAGRPKTSADTTTISLRLPSSACRILDQIAEARGQSRTEYLRDTILRELTIDKDSI